MAHSFSEPEQTAPDVWHTDVLIIGGGATGTGIARDLALRGISCIVAEWRDLAAGASGANHGLLHSGARYVNADRDAAIECREEGNILKKLAPQCIENTEGIFAAIDGDDAGYITRFPELCGAAGIDVRALDVKEAHALEPSLSPKLIAAYVVPDASIDPFRLCLDNMAHARTLAGSFYMPHTRIKGLEIKNGRISAALGTNTQHGAIRIVAKQYVNAAGAWAGEIASLAGASIPMVLSKGTLLVTHDRLAHRVINRLRPPGNGDILVPGGTVSVLGTTSVRLSSMDNIAPSIREVEENIRQGAEMVPELASVRYIRAYAGVRPLVGDGNDDRKVSRNFSLLLHEDREDGGLENFMTITGGKLTTYRLMAERTTDALCTRLSVSAPCRTREETLPAVSASSWTEPAKAAAAWVHKHEPDDPVLCECEMIQKSVVEEIVTSLPDTDSSLLHAIGLRSRLGKGPCQGAFCSIRTTSALYDNGTFTSRAGVEQLISFLRSRFKGQRSVLWGAQMAQAELAEAIHCGLFSLEIPARNEVSHD